MSVIVTSLALIVRNMFDNAFKCTFQRKVICIYWQVFLMQSYCNAWRLGFGLKFMKAKPKEFIYPQATTDLPSYLILTCLQHEIVTCFANMRSRDKIDSHAGLRSYLPFLLYCINLICSSIHYLERSYWTGSMHSKTNI